MFLNFENHLFIERILHWLANDNYCMIIFQYQEISLSLSVEEKQIIYATFIYMHTPFVNYVEVTDVRGLRHSLSRLGSSVRDCNVSFGISNSCLLSTPQLWQIGSDLTPFLTQSQCRIAYARSTVAGLRGLGRHSATFSAFTALARVSRVS